MSINSDFLFHQVLLLLLQYLLPVLLTTLDITYHVNDFNDKIVRQLLSFILDFQTLNTLTFRHFLVLHFPALHFLSVIFQSCDINTHENVRPKCIIYTAN